MDFNPRYPGTPGINATAEYIHDILNDTGADTSFHEFSVNGVPCRNVLGKYGAGQDSSEIIIVASHYDARARSDRDPDPELRDDPVPAANDGGSSTAILLELARIVEIMHATLDISKETWLVFFDAEDQGSGGMQNFGWIEGSTKFAQDLDSFLEVYQSIELFMLLDMVGDDDLKIDGELNSDQELLSEFFALGQCLGYADFFPQNPVYRRITDDHVPFKTLGIPSIDIIDLDYPEWHTTKDDLDHVSKQSIGGIGRVAEGFLLRKLVGDENVTLHDPHTGCTWSEGSCKGDGLDDGFIAFIKRYWYVFLIVGVVGVSIMIILKKHPSEF